MKLTIREKDGSTSEVILADDDRLKPFLKDGMLDKTFVIGKWQSLEKLLMHVTDYLNSYDEGNEIDSYLLNKRLLESLITIHGVYAAVDDSMVEAEAVLDG